MEPRFDPSRHFDPITPQFDPNRQFEGMNTGAFANFWAEVSAAEPQKKKEKSSVSRTESALRGAGQGATLGFGDEISGRLEKGIASLFGALGLQDQSVTDLYDSKTVQDLVQTHRDQNRAAQEANPGTYLAGQVGGSIPGAVALPGGSIGRLAATGAGLGAASAVGHSEAEDMGTLAKQGAMGAALGGGLGAAGGAIGRGLAGARSGAGRQAERFAVGATGNKKKLIEDLGEKGIQKLGRKLMNEKIVTPGAAKGDVLRNLEKAVNTTGKNIGKVVEKADRAARGQYAIPERALKSKVTQELIKPMRGMAGRKADADFIEKFLNRELFSRSGRGKLTLDEILKFRRSIDKQITKWGGPAPDMGKQAALRDIRWGLEEFVESQMKSLGQAGQVSKNLVNQYGRLKDSYSTLMKGLGLAEDTASRMQGNRMFSPTDYAAAVGGAATRMGTEGGGGVQTGIAAAIGNKILRERGNQLAMGGADIIDRLGQRVTDQTFQTTGRIAGGALVGGGSQVGARVTSPRRKSFAQFVNENPTAFGRFSDEIQEAAAGGEQELAIKHYELSNQEPDYQRDYYGGD